MYAKICWIHFGRSSRPDISAQEPKRCSIELHGAYVELAITKAMQLKHSSTPLLRLCIVLMVQGTCVGKGDQLVNTLSVVTYSVFRISGLFSANQPAHQIPKSTLSIWIWECIVISDCSQMDSCWSDLYIQPAHVFQTSMYRGTWTYTVIYPSCAVVPLILLSFKIA